MSDENPKQRDRDERVAIPLEPEEALRALLKVDPDSAPAGPRAGKGKAQNAETAP